VREAVGICDVTTLGKIDIQGPDAATLLERVYINSWKNLPVGRARYGVMLREDGMVMDDGTTARLAEDRFVMTTTTVNAAKVAQHLEFCQQWLWPELDVQSVSVTEQWAQLAVAGPRSRAGAGADRRCWLRYLGRRFPLHVLRRVDGVRRRAGAAVPALLLR
jgi:glycine cleavage system aminomethyltransferase T